MRPQWITLNIKVAEKASNMRIAVLGECYVELSHYPICQTIGGDDFHIAVYLARLGQYKHFQIDFASAVGLDPFTQAWKQVCRDEHISLGLTEQRSAQFPHFYYPEYQAKNQIIEHHWQDNTAFSTLFSHSITKLERAIELKQIDVLYLSAFAVSRLDDKSKIILVTLLEALKHQGGKCIFNCYCGHYFWTVKQSQYWVLKILSYADLAFVLYENEHKRWRTIGEGMYHLMRSGCSEIIVSSSAKLVISERMRQLMKSSQSRLYFYRSVGLTKRISNGFIAGYIAGFVKGEMIEYRLSLGREMMKAISAYPYALVPISAMKSVLSND